MTAGAEGTASQYKRLKDLLYAHPSMLDTLCERILRWWFRAPATGASQLPRIKAIYAYNEGPEHMGGYHRTISRDFSEALLERQGTTTWEPLLRSKIPDEWGDTYRLEIRYELRGKKYRAVVRPGNVLELMAPVNAPRLLSARLMPRPETDANIVDVTTRALKYAGTSRTFDNVRMCDLFPFDDHDDNATRFACIRFIDATFRCWDVPYDLSENREVYPEVST